MRLTKKSTIGDVLNAYDNAEEILTGFGLHCFGCPMSRMESLEEAAQVHGIDINFMMTKLKEDLVASEPKAKRPTCKCGCAAKTTKTAPKKTTKKENK